MSRLLLPILDRPAIDLDTVVSLLAEEAPEPTLDIDGLAAEARALPPGLIFAEQIWITAEAPIGVQPLTPGGAWYALDGTAESPPRTLVSVVAPGRRALLSAVRAIGQYVAVARQVHARLAGAAELTGAAVEGGLPAPELLSQLALRLDVPFAGLARAMAASATLLRELGAMAARPFRPAIRLHASARPAAAARSGEGIGRRLLEQLPPGPFRVALSDSWAPVEHLSPYLRDLRQALLLWGRENADQLATPGLAGALGGAGDPTPADPDLLALLLPDLFAGRPELVAERREAERGVGLLLEETAGALWGWADLSRLEAADPVAVPRGASGAVVVLAGGPEELRVEAVRALLDSGRVSAIGAQFGAAPLAAPIATPEVVLSRDDGARLEGAARLEQRAKELGLACARPAVLALEDSGVSDAALEVVRLVRRAESLAESVAAARPQERSHPRTNLCCVFYARPPRGSGVAEHLAALRSSRLLLAILEENDPRTQKRHDPRTKLPSSVRFRV
jgi:hypothetical protein